MLVTVACEHSPIFLANRDEEGLITLDSSVMESVLEWYNSLTKPNLNPAYYQPDSDCYCFEESPGVWSEYPNNNDGTYLCPDWLPAVGACPECLCYVPCDCEHHLLSDDELTSLETYALVNHDISMEQVRNLIYTARELDAQLREEQR